MQSSRRLIQTVRFAMLVSVALYAWLVWRLPSTATPNPTFFRAIAAVAVFLVIVIFVTRRTRLSRTEVLLAAQPQDAKVLMRWRQGYVVTYAMSEAIVLYGVVLHFTGFPLSQVAPFFIAGALLMLFLGPKSIPIQQFPPDGILKQ
jgi:hypothetical protein